MLMHLLLGFVWQELKEASTNVTLQTNLKVHSKHEYKLSHLVSSHSLINKYITTKQKSHNKFWT